MSAKLTEQDLTDYALNELGPEERLYVESMLAVSEESREDIYKTIDLALMIEEGFECHEEVEPVLLTLEQRNRLLNARMPNRFFHRAAVVLAAAAAVALAFARADAWLPKTRALEVARVSSQVSSYVAQAVSSADGDDFVSQLATFRRLTEDPLLKKWFSSQPVGGSAVFGSGTSMSFEASPRGAFELMQ